MSGLGGMSVVADPRWPTGPAGTTTRRLRHNGAMRVPRDSNPKHVVRTRPSNQKAWPLDFIIRRHCCLIPFSFIHNSTCLLMLHERCSVSLNYLEEMLMLPAVANIP